MRSRPSDEGAEVVGAEAGEAVGSPVCGIRVRPRADRQAPAAVVVAADAAAPARRTHTPISRVAPKHSPSC